MSGWSKKRIALRNARRRVIEAAIEWARSYARSYGSVAEIRLMCKRLDSAVRSLRRAENMKPTRRPR
jgi:Tfp pilus assembly protein PilF